MIGYMNAKERGGMTAKPEKARNQWEKREGNGTCSPPPEDDSDPPEVRRPEIRKRADDEDGNRYDPAL